MASVDWMLINLEKVHEDDDTVAYCFSADVSEPNPRHKHGTIVVGRVKGTLVLDKGSGEIVLPHPMPHDDKQMCFRRAARKVWEAWEKKAYPETMVYACG